MKKVVVVTVVVCLILVLIMSLFFIFNIPNRKLIVVGTDFYPDCYYNEDGELDGVMIELVSVIFGWMNIPYAVNLNFGWENAQQEVRGGRADMLLSASHKKEREDFLYYSDEQKNWRNELPSTLQTFYTYSFFTNKENSNKFDSFETFEDIIEIDHMLGMVEEMSYVEEIIDLNLNLYVYRNVEDMINSFYRGEIDSFIGINNDVYILIDKLGLDVDELVNVKVLDTRIAFALFSKTSESGWLKKIRKDFYDEFLKMVHSGEYIEIVEREYRELNIPVPEMYYNVN